MVKLEGRDKLRDTMEKRAELLPCFFALGDTEKKEAPMYGLARPAPFNTEEKKIMTFMIMDKATNMKHRVIRNRICNTWARWLTKDALVERMTHVNTDHALDMGTLARLHAHQKLLIENQDELMSWVDNDEKRMKAENEVEWLSTTTKVKKESNTKGEKCLSQLSMLNALKKHSTTAWKNMMIT